MIGIKRYSIHPPHVLTGKTSKGAKETARVVEYMEQKVSLASKTKRPSFSAYADGEVKEVLSTLFGGKCAYCESRYASTQPVDIEHYRPKAGVDEDPSHPGYYWLAANWDNLLPSCIDCNRVRLQKVRELTTENTSSENSGKGGRFPLFDSTKRARNPTDILSDEQPLLLNPCVDDPKLFFIFTSDGIVKASQSHLSLEQKRAETSIAIYGLNRPGLVYARLEVLRLLQARMFTISRLVRVLDKRKKLTMPLAVIIEDLVAYEMAELNAFSHHSRPYSQMCAQMIDEFMKTFQ